MTSSILHPPSSLLALNLFQQHEMPFAHVQVDCRVHHGCIGGCTCYRRVFGQATPTLFNFAGTSLLFFFGLGVTASTTLCQRFCNLKIRCTFFLYLVHFLLFSPCAIPLMLTGQQTCFLSACVVAPAFPYHTQSFYFIF